MQNLGEEEQKNISQFIELSLSLILRGFDEMEMQKRLELVKLLGFMLNFGFEKTYGKMIDLEKRVRILEQCGKKK
jgi:hypothetical protein